MARVRQFRFALRLTAGQERAVHRLVDAQCELYNAALQERRETYRLARARALVPPRVGYVHQCRQLTAILAERPELAAYGTTVCRGTLRRVGRAFSAFFRRLSAGGRPGYPRFRSVRRFDSVSYEDRSGWKLDASNGRLYLKGVGHLRLRLHRSIPEGAVLRSAVLRRERVLRRAGHPTRARWSVSVAVALPEAEPKAPTGRRCGLDVGVRYLASVLDDRGVGYQVPGPQPLQAAAGRLAAAQRRVARAQRGSSRRAMAVRDLAGAQAKVARIRAWWAHQLSRELVASFDLIAIEDLRVASMSRSARGSVEQPGANVAAKAGAEPGHPRCRLGQATTVPRVQSGRCWSRARGRGSPPHLPGVCCLRAPGAGQPARRSVLLPGLRPCRRCRSQRRGQHSQTGRVGPAAIGCVVASVTLTFATDYL